MLALVAGVCQESRRANHYTICHPYTSMASLTLWSYAWLAWFACGWGGKSVTCPFSSGWQYNQGCPFPLGFMVRPNSNQLWGYTKAQCVSECAPLHRLQPSFCSHWSWNVTTCNVAKQSQLRKCHQCCTSFNSMSLHQNYLSQNNPLFIYVVTYFGF